MGIVWMTSTQMNKVGFYFCEDVIKKYGFWHCTHSEYLSNLLQGKVSGGFKENSLFCDGISLLIFSIIWEKDNKIFLLVSIRQGNPFSTLSRVFGDIPAFLASSTLLIMRLSLISFRRLVATIALT
jgi:hypothetical protein